MKTYPENKDQYWRLVDQHWADLINIVYMYAPNKVEDASNYRLNQDPKINNVFQDSWWNAPDSPSIHYIPSWSVLCNLCSEAHVLFDEDGSPL
jgi:hypothetical protein